MNLEILQNKKQECRTWKNVEPWYLQLQEACKIEKSDLEIDYGDWFSVGKKEDLTNDEYEVIVYHHSTKVAMVNMTRVIEMPKEDYNIMMDELQHDCRGIDVTTKNIIESFGHKIYVEANELL